MLSPTQDTLAALGVSGAEAIAKGLKDPDRRLGLILEAVVDAYAADPSQAVTLLDFDQGEIVLSDAWPLPLDAARRIDFVLLEDASLVKIIPTAGSSNIDIVPTGLGRDVVTGALGALDELVEDAEDEKDKRRLTRVREKVVGAGKATAPGVISGLIVKALTT